MTEESNPGLASIMRVLALAWAVGIVMVGILPLSNFVGHSHWEYIEWVPTFDNLRWRRHLFDIVANTSLFIPFGYFVAHAVEGPPAHRLRLVGGLSAVLSCGIEFFQVYCHNRHPSPLDIVANVLGGLIGTAVVVLISWMRHRSPTNRITPIPPARNLAP